MTEAESGAGQKQAAAAPPTAPGLGQALAGVLAQFREVVASLTRLADIRVEQARLATRRLLFLVALGLWLSVVLVAATAVAVSYVVAGLAGMLAEQFGGRIWVAELATGGIVLGLILAVGLIGRVALQWANLRRLRRKYEAGEGSR